jgi:hypothetical protein
MLGGRRGALPRLVWAVIIGVFLGALFTTLAIRYLPDSAGREFLTTSVSASIGPLGLDLVAIALVVGPLVLNLNALTVVGVLIVVLVMRSWWF